MYRLENWVRLGCGRKEALRRVFGKWKYGVPAHGVTVLAVFPFSTLLGRPAGRPLPDSHPADPDRPMTRARLSNRPGFTMIEIFVVIAILAVIYVMIGPRIAELRSRSSLRAARQELSSAIAAARAAALQKGKTATLTLASNTATVTVLSGLAGGSVQILGPIRFDKTLNSTLTALSGAPTSIAFDARGLVSPVPTGISKYRLANGVYADTVCVSAAGIILPRGCTL